MLARQIIAFVSLVILQIFAPLTAQAADSSAYDELLGRYVVVSGDGINRVRYAAWVASKEDVGTLDEYVTSLENKHPSTLSREEQLAHWINLYNAVTLQVILENYPVKSIRDIRSKTLDPRGLIGPWLTPRVTVEGRRLSLDQIENSILRPQFKEPRIHYAINCASIGCPNLAARAWRAESMEADLTEAARRFINHPRGLSVDANGKIRASSIYKWFAADFGGDAAKVLAHTRSYASPDLQRRLAKATTIAGYGYDWSLNAVK